MVAVPGGDGNTGSLVQQAVEDFVDRCTAGEEPDPELFAATWPEPVRARIKEQCRQFLQFDDFVGKQDWSAQDLAAHDGRAFGDFVIQEELGRGGMGIVYLAHQRSLNRRVALKVMASGLTLSKRHVERFRREATAAAQLRHPGIVPVHSFTEVDGTFAFAMDYIAGRNLGEILDDLRLANGPQPPEIEGTLGLQPENGYVAECAALCAQIASALAAAHATGIAHRDIKPRNIMIDESRQARLLDFGLAKSLDQGSISLSGEITGTAHYMSPEQTLAKRVPLDHRTDIFSLGVILYEMLTLRRPFDGKNLQQVVYEICFKEPPPVARLNPKLPRDLVTVCMKALEKDPQNRYQTAREFEADLLRFLRWEPIHARPAGPLTRLSKLVQRHRAESAALALLATAGLCAAGIAWFRAAEAKARSDQLMGLAQTEAGQGHYEAAIQHATEAVTLQPGDATLRARLEQLQRVEAEANLLLARSSQLLEKQNREVALRLALMAVDRRDSPFARSAVLEALGAGYRTITFGAGRNPQKVRLSPDGSFVAAAMLAGPPTLWDAATGVERRQFPGHGNALDLAFHPDGQRLATANEHEGASLWSIDGRELAHLEQEGTVELVQFDRNGDRLLAASYVDYAKGPFLVRVWDTATGGRLGACAAHARYVEVAAISPCGRYVASSGDAGFVRLWDAATGTELARLAGHNGRIRDLAFAPDSGLVATACHDGSARVFSVPDGRLLRAVRHSKGIDSVRFNGDGRRLLTAGRDQTARLWDLHLDVAADVHAGAEEVLTLLGHGGAVMRAAFDPGGHYVVTACQDSVVRVFDIGNGTELMRYEVGHSIEDAAFDGNGSRVLMLAGHEHAVLWDLDGARGTVTLRQKTWVRAACFDKDGTHAITAGDDESVRVWNARDGHQLSIISGLGDLQAVDVDPKSQRILTATLDGRVEFHGHDGSRLSSFVAHRGKIHAAAFSADGNRVVTCGEDGTAAVWNAIDTTLVMRVGPLSQPVTAAALSPDGAVLATVEKDATSAQLWSVASGDRLRSITGHTGVVRAVAFAPDGEGVLTAGDDGTARLWRLDGRSVQQFTAGVPLARAAFARTGDTLLTCSGPDESAAQLWDVEKGELRLRFTGHRAPVLWGALSADGAWAITGSRDQTAKIWPTDPVAIARQLPLRDLTAAERLALGPLPPVDPPPK